MPPSDGSPASATASVRAFELLGLQGAGKTTIARLLDRRTDAYSVERLIERERLRVRELRRHRVAMRLLPRALKLRVLTGPSPDAKDAAAFVHRHRRFNDAVLRACDKVDATADRELALQLLFESWSHYSFAHRVARPGDGLLLHEGILQRLAFLLALNPEVDEQLRDDLLDTVPYPTGVVFLDLPLEDAIARVQTRGGDEFTMTEIMPTMERHLWAFVARLRCLGIPLLEVASDRPLAQSARDVETFLREHLAP